MIKPLPYNPFEKMSFSDNICFLTGEELEAGHKSYVQVFPFWLLERYGMEHSVITMLGGFRIKYKDMMLPASKKVAEAINELDAVTQKAFENGYEAVKQLSEQTIFQWMARVMYGVIYQEVKSDAEEYQTEGRQLNMSEVMLQKLKNLHLMLQSLVRPIRFEGFTPWSMKCNPVRISKDILNYKDETRKLNFCLNMNGFGIVACMQDNGFVSDYYKKELQTIGDHTLHPVQFEELYGKFIYVNYLLRESKDYEFTEDPDGTLVFHLPKESDEDAKLPKLAPWSDDTYAQLLANLWQPWGFTQPMVYTFPNSPLSFLINEATHQFINPENINLDY